MKAFLLKNCNGKALVTEFMSDEAELTSYETVVAYVVDGNAYRKDGQPQSVTTAKHMREFFALYGFPRMTKAQLEKLPIL